MNLLTKTKKVCYYENAMKELIQNPTKGYLIAFGLITVILSLIKLSYGIGFILGIVFSIININVLISQINQMMFEKKFNPWIGIPLYMLKTFILVIPMFLSVLYPNWINLFAVVGGLLSPKLKFYIDELFLKKENHD